jgi:lysophospholipase L1-like esterase
MITRESMVDFRVCFVGDSITHGTGDPKGLGWPGRAHLAAARIGRPFTLYNLGVRGDTSEDVRRRWVGEVSHRLIPGTPGAIVFAFGLNDALADASGSWRVQPKRLIENSHAMFQEARRRWPVVVVGPAPVDDTRPPPRSPQQVGPVWLTSNPRVAEASQAIQEVAEGLQVPFLDLFSGLVAEPRWLSAMALSDAVHPASGYSLISERFEQWPAWQRVLELVRQA